MSRSVVVTSCYVRPMPCFNVHAKDRKGGKVGDKEVYELAPASARKPIAGLSDKLGRRETATVLQFVGEDTILHAQ